MKEKKSKTRLLFTLTLIVYTFAWGLYAYLEYSNHKNEVLKNIDLRLYNTAVALKYILPDDYHDRAIDEEAISIEEDMYNVRKFVHLAKDAGIKYNYTIIKKGENLFFVATVVEGAETKRGTYYFYDYTNEADRSFFEAFDRTTPTYNTVSDQWGTVRTVMVPQTSPGGIRYLACADYDVGYVKELLQKNLLRSIATVVFFLFLSVLIILSYRKLRGEHFEAQEESEAKYRKIIEDAPVGVFRSTPSGKFLRSNILFAQTIGFETPDKLINGVSNIAAIYVNPEQREEVKHQILANGEVIDFEIELKHRRGHTVWVSVSLLPVFDVNGEIQAYEGFSVNITKRKGAEKENINLESQLRQAQKLEAIGTMAGGIAHDFNNILAAIFGYSELAKLDIPEHSPANQHIKQVILASNRAKDLVSNILAFSRASSLNQGNVPIILGPIVKEILKFQRSIIPTTIEIKSKIDEDCGMISGDHTQIHQVIMNLCTNASHAMEKNGGTLEVGLCKFDFSSTDTKIDPNIHPGTYLKLSVRDTGVGLTPELIEKIFDPYFTTKEVGKGTGLGLSVVHGIVNNHSGFVKVESVLGKGSTFNVFFPIVKEKIISIEADETEEIPTGTEKVLFVDDEVMLTDIGKSMLERLGYSVTSVNDSTEALNLFKDDPTMFDLVITDQTMPNISGSELAKQLLQIRADIPIILCTGYSSLINEVKAQKIGIREYALKPVSKTVMTQLIRKVLDGDEFAK